MVEVAHQGEQVSAGAPSPRGKGCGTRWPPEAGTGTRRLLPAHVPVPWEQTEQHKPTVTESHPHSGQQQRWPELSPEQLSALRVTTVCEGRRERSTAATKAMLSEEAAEQQQEGAGGSGGSAGPQHPTSGAGGRARGCHGGPEQHPAKQTRCTRSRYPFFFFSPPNDNNNKMGAEGEPKSRPGREGGAPLETQLPAGRAGGETWRRGARSRRRPAAP